MMTDYDKPLNLAHQFLDDNFLPVITSSSIGKLPLISSNIRDNIQNEMESPKVIDFCSYQFETQEEIYNCWKSVNNNKFMKPYELSNIFSLKSLNQFSDTHNKVEDIMLLLPSTSSIRLENVSWRAWSKKMNNLKELDPNAINWFKENDVTAIYGPIVTKSSKCPYNAQHTKAYQTMDVDEQNYQQSGSILDSEAEDEDNNLYSEVVNGSFRLERSDSTESSNSFASSTPSESESDSDLKSDYSFSSISSRSSYVASPPSSACGKTPKYKSILKRNSKKRFSMFDAQRNLNMKKNSVSFNIEVETREIIGGCIFDQTCIRII